jgi:hypothetical protein
MTNGGVSEAPAWERPRAVARLIRFWERWREPLVWVGVAYSVVAAAGRLWFALPHLLTDVEVWSAVDFKYRYEEVARWFAGLPVYGALDRLTYPPASYALLWPAMGWLPLGTARAVWGVTIMAAAAAIAFVAYRVAEGHARSVRVLVALLAFAAYPIQVTVFVGQLPMHVVALAAAGTLVLAKAPRGWATDGVAAALLAASLVKPTLAPPLVAAALIGAGRWRPALLAAGFFIGLSLIGAGAQPDSIVTLHRAWLESSANPALAGGIAEGVPNLHVLLSRGGLGAWAPVASVVVLAVFAAWSWRHRRADVWVLVGVAAVVARLWSYHREYDDAVLLLSALALLRVARRPDQRAGRAAAVLFAATWAALLTPTWALFSPNAAVVGVIWAAHTLLWLGVLLFLVLRAGHSLDGEARPA